MDEPAEKIPPRIGIRALSVYFPRNVVLQEELEKFNNESAGKYTVGFGQHEMGFCADNEDVVSISLTVTDKLLRDYQIDPATIGFLAVGTETLIDKSKSVKTELMRLFGENLDIEGVDEKNACFGGTQALLHAVDWIKGNSLDGRLAIAVCADIAIYEPGPARCTGGAGAIAFLIGPDAPIAFEPSLKACHMKPNWDFYKPIGHISSEYPVVDGQLSLRSYMEAVEGCYDTLKKKAKRIRKEELWLGSFDAVFFHSPFTSLVQKAIARLMFQDFLAGKGYNGFNKDALEGLVQRYREDPKILEKREETNILKENSQCQWKSLTSPFLEINRRVGNMYTPSLFVQLVTYLARAEKLDGTRVLFFAYGSGSAAAMFTARVKDDGPQGLLHSMKRHSLSTLKLLDARTVHSPETYTEALAMREKLLSLVTNGSFYDDLFIRVSETRVPESLKREEFTPFTGAFFLKSIDGQQRREYGRVAEDE